MTSSNEPTSEEDDSKRQSIMNESAVFDDSQQTQTTQSAAAAENKMLESTQQMLDNIEFTDSQFPGNNKNKNNSNSKSKSKLNNNTNQKDSNANPDTGNDNNKENNNNSNSNTDNSNSNSNNNKALNDGELGMADENENGDGAGAGYGGEEIDVKERMREDICLLRIGYSNEKLSPEILEYDEEIVENIKKYIELREEQIDELTQEIQNFNHNTGDSNTTDNSLQINQTLLPSVNIWWRTELERIKFLLHAYLRVRLWKVQKYALYVLTNEQIYQKLSPAEQKFAAGYSQITEQHLTQTFLSELPKQYTSLTDAETSMIVKPNIEVFKIMRVNEDIGRFMIEGGENELDLKQSDILVSKYHNFQQLIADGFVDLI